MLSASFELPAKLKICCARLYTAQGKFKELFGCPSLPGLFQKTSLLPSGTLSNLFALSPTSTLSILFSSMFPLLFSLPSFQRAGVGSSKLLLSPISKLGRALALYLRFLLYPSVQNPSFCFHRVEPLSQRRLHPASLDRVLRVSRLFTRLAGGNRINLSQVHVVNHICEVGYRRGQDIWRRRTFICYGPCPADGTRQRRGTLHSFCHL